LFCFTVAFRLRLFVVVAVRARAGVHRRRPAEIVGAFGIGAFPARLDANQIRAAVARIMIFASSGS
jgi:hypothetical protein